jgi:DNA ligase (NAD+)
LNQTDDLAARLEAYNRAYRDGAPLISDAEYDRLVEELRRMDPQHSFLQTVEPERFDTRAEIRHPAPMLSIEKVYLEKKGDIERLQRFVRNAENAGMAMGLTEVIFRATVKLDGLAGRDDGHVFATRGNGFVGYEISVVFEKGVQPIGGRGQGLGEIVVVRSYFEDRLTGAFEHPRNMVVGIVSSDTLNPDAQRALVDGQVHFVPYNQLPQWIGDGDGLLDNIDSISDDLMKDTDYPMDGLVVEVIDPLLRNHLGATAHHYRWQIAVKRKGETAQTTVSDVIWQVGRTGHVTPVLEVDPVTLSGATIRRVTAHNATRLVEEKIGPGAVVEIIRSGEVIPKIERVVQTVSNVSTPKVCPRCATALIWKSSANDRTKDTQAVAFLFCGNPSCPGQVEEKISHWFRTMGNADWFGIKTIQKMVAAGYDSLEKVYTMTVSDFQNLGLGPVQSENLAEALSISRTKPVEDWRFLAALGIEKLGLGDSRKLLSHFPLDKLIDLDPEAIRSIKGFKARKSETMVHGIAMVRDTFRHLMDLGFNLERTPLISEIEAVDSPVAGKKIVFTGKMTAGSRKEMQARARSLGALVQSSVSGATDYLVCGENVGASKLEKAKRLGLRMLSEEEYNQLLASGSD